eukprot:586020-Karenia_brevis.AAC.1
MNINIMNINIIIAIISISTIIIIIIMLIIMFSFLLQRLSDRQVPYLAINSELVACVRQKMPEVVSSCLSSAIAIGTRTITNIIA